MKNKALTHDTQQMTAPSSTHSYASEAFLATCDHSRRTPSLSPPCCPESLLCRCRVKFNLKAFLPPSLLPSVLFLFLHTLPLILPLSIIPSNFYCLSKVTFIQLHVYCRKCTYLLQTTQISKRRIYNFPKPHGVAPLQVCVCVCVCV